MSRTLKVNYVGATLVVQGPITGRRYEYRPGDDNGRLWNVSEEDVPEMLKMVVKARDCGCSKDGGSTSSTEQYPLFEET